MVMQPRIRQEFGQMPQESVCGRQDRWRELLPANSLGTPKSTFHEFGHIIGRLPEDDDSWDEQSARNTAEVLRHCRSEIRSTARKPPRLSGTH